MIVSTLTNLIRFTVNEADVNKANDAINQLNRTAKKMLGALGIAVSVVGVKNAISQCVALSSEVEEMENKFNVVFEGITDTVDKWASDYADSIGRNKNDIKTYLADLQNLLTGFGMTKKEAAGLSEASTSLALDIASFANLDETTAVNNMTKAIMGQSEAAKMLGAAITEDTRKEAIAALGYKGTYESLSQLQKMQVNYNVILAQSQNAVGDCARSINSYAARQRQFNAVMKEVKTEIGQFFMPTIKDLYAFGSKCLMKIRDGIQSFKEFADKMGGSRNVIKLFGIAIGVAFSVANLGKVAKFLSLLKGITLQSVLAKVKMLALIAIFVLIALLVEDFIGFMQGKDSLIGKIFGKLGIDADKARDSVKKLMPLIGGIISIILMTVMAVKMLSLATLIVNAIMAASPITWIIIGIIALIAVIILLVKNWDVVKEKAIEVWNKIVDTFASAANWFKENVVDPIANFFTDLWNGITEGISNVVNGVKEKIDKVKAFFGIEGSASNAGAASRASARTASNTTNSRRSVTQNVVINNRFDGSRDVQKNASKAANKASNDTTGQLARGLAYAR